MWEAKKQWLSALMSTTAMCIREQQDGQAVCTQLPSHSLKGSVSRGATPEAQQTPVLNLTALLTLRTPVQPSPPPFTRTGIGWEL